MTRHRDGLARVPLSAEETALLIRAQPDYREPLGLAFGPSGAWLDADCKWPLPLLAEWRGLAFNHGAGI